MQPSEGMPGVILRGSEYHKIKDELNAYKVAFGPEAETDVLHVLQRINYIEGIAGDLGCTTLPADVAQKVSNYMIERENNRPTDTTVSGVDFVKAALGIYIYQDIRSMQRVKFARCLDRASKLSLQIAHEQVIPRH